MKHLYFLIALSCICFFNAQTQPTFKKYLGLNITSIYSSQVIPTSDTGSVVVGYGSIGCTRNCKRSIYYYRLDKYGNTLISKTFTDSIYSLSRPWYINTADTGFFIIAEVYEVEESKYRGFTIIRCDKNGEILSYSRISAPEIDGRTPVKVLNDADGNISMVFESGMTPRIVRLNKKGRLVWGKTFVPAYDDNLFAATYHIHTVIEKNGNVYLGGYSDIQAYDNEDYKGFIIGINKNGRGFLFRKFEEKRTVGYWNNSGAAASYLFFVNDELFVYGSIMNKYCYFKTLDTATGFLYTRPTTIINPLSYNYFIFKHPEVKSYFYNSYPDGGVPLLNYGSGIITGKMDSLFRICPDFVNPPLYDTTTDTGRVQLYNANYSTAVFEVYQNEAKVTGSAFIDKDSLVCSSGIKNSKAIANNIAHPSLKKSLNYIYPNPANNNIYLNFNAEKDNQVIIQVFNNNGKMVRSEKVYFIKGFNLKSIDISQLSNGSYFMKLMTETGQENFTFLKQQ